jgi:tRNA-splicing ligase RtcB
MGTLGAGNHFVEISLDEHDRVWAVLHSGSRGIGNLLAQSHIAEAKSVAKRLNLQLEDPDLAYLLEGTPEFEHYLADLLFAQAYARTNRDTMLDALLDALFGFVGKGAEVDRVNCHHNYTEQERHYGKTLWITRKGAISAQAGEPGIIPGSMGTDTYLVAGKGNPDSYTSSAHGAGRRMSRTRARKTLTASSLTRAMEGRTWLGNKASRLVDEHPEAYKDIEEVMRLSADLVEIEHRLRAILNYKGT